MTRTITICLAAVVVGLAALSAAALAFAQAAPDVLTPEESAKYDLIPQELSGDTGINVLIDSSHHAFYELLWDTPNLLREAGFRVVANLAVFDEALAPGKLSRVRVPVDEREPFGWKPNPDYNVVLTYQSGPNLPSYLPEEMETLKQFVSAGGGLILVGGPDVKSEGLDEWPMQALAGLFRGSFTDKQVTYRKAKAIALKVGRGWTPLLKGDDGSMVAASRKWGKGRVVLVGSWYFFRVGHPTSPQGQTRDEYKLWLSGLIKWAAGGRQPVGGSRALPTYVYPESEEDVGQVRVFYAKNQKPEMLAAVRDEMPKVRDQVLQWFPSVMASGYLNVILAGGGWGGWAVNAVKPEEIAIIPADPEILLRIFAHELAHNLRGPANDEGQTAGFNPNVPFVEAHAEWFARKIHTLRTGRCADIDPAKMFEFDPDGTRFDLAKTTREEYSKGCCKLIYVFQKLDERYGNTWYPRWWWVKNVRWQDQPDKQLTWDEVVEDMSIAVGEDLFPFFRKLGTRLTKDRFPQATFYGETIVLPVADIDITKPGAAVLGLIGDYKQPLLNR